MKPKLNILQETIECKEPLIEDIPNLLGGPLSMTTAVFDATAYCEAEGLTMDPYHVFYAQCQRYINARIEEENIKTPNLFYQNTDGHLLIHASLALIFLKYVAPDMSVYFDNMVMTCLLNGLAFSDSFAARIAMLQVSDEVLQDIMKTRHEQEKQQSQQ